MNELSIAPDLSGMDIPENAWTQPFWEGAARSELALPHCAECGAHRWPPGPFCPSCRSQSVSWKAAGPAVLYSYTIVRSPPKNLDQSGAAIVPGLVAFPESGGVRLMASIIDTPLCWLRVGAALQLRWIPHGNTNVPAFAIISAGEQRCDLHGG